MELSWISSILKSVGVPQTEPAEIYCDNLSAVHLTANPVLHKKSKHFATHYHFARERVAAGTLIVKHIPAAQQLADIFTKSLPQQSFIYLRFKLGVALPPISSLHGDIKANGPASAGISKTMLGFTQTKPTAKSATRQTASTVTEAVKGKDKDSNRMVALVQLSDRYDALEDQDD